MATNKESTVYVFTIAFVLCLVCATLVSLAAVGLKPIQDANAAKEKKRNILVAAGIYKEGDDIEAMFKGNIKPLAIELATGEAVDHIDLETFDGVKAAKNPQTGKSLTEDPAKIGYIANHEVIYQYWQDDQLSRVILPVRGYGLWGTMYGFMALDGEGKTIQGLTFYDQKETPGLGAEIANPKWQAIWVGKKPFASGDEPNIRVVKTVSQNPNEAQSQIDSLAGATLTSRGVEYMVNFWLSDAAYGPYLKQLKQ